jgi:hypothetical protein
MSKASSSYLISGLLSFGLGIPLELFLVIAIFKYKDVLDVNVSSWGLIKTYFWRACGINIISVFWALLLLSPFCFFIYLLMLTELNSIRDILLVVGFFLLNILGFGARDLGIRILLDRDTGIQESIWMGLKELYTHRANYLPFAVTQMLLGHLTMVLTILFSGIWVGAGRSLVDFYKLLDGARESQCSILLLFNYIILPLNLTATTLMYLDRKFEATAFPQQVVILEPSNSE